MTGWVRAGKKVGLAADAGGAARIRRYEDILAMNGYGKRRLMSLRAVAVCGAVVVLAAGCNKKADNTSNYKSAINGYFGAHPVCLWQSEKRFPVQAATADQGKTEGYDALVDAGLLTRTTAEKKKFIVASEQVNNYDLSDKGRSAWTADANQPGYGNFCYGHRSVSSVDGSTPTNDQVGATTTVNYKYTVDGAPDWAKSAETQTAFPQLRSELSGTQGGTATLTDTNNGWQVSSVPNSGSGSVSGADGKIVQ